MNSLNLSELLERASKSEQCLKEAQSVFERSYASKTFRISGPFVANGEKSIFDEKEFTRISNFDVVKQFLHAFGKYVKRLSVYFDEINADEGKAIVKQINDECSSSTALKSLHLLLCGGNVLDELKSRFPSVSQLAFSSSKKDELKIPSDAPKLAYLFPSVNVLSLNHSVPSDWEFIGKRYPYLHSWGVELESEIKGNLNVNEQAISFLKENSQINTTVISHSDLKFLKEFSEISPKLDTLKLKPFSKNYQNSKDPIRFETLRNLIIESIDNDVYPEHIHFDHLQYLNIIQSEFSEKWPTFLSQQVNHNLSRLEIESKTLKNEHILEIAEKKPNLVTAKFQSRLNINADTIIEFINKLEYLYILQLDVLMSSSDALKLQAKAPKKWTAVVISVPPGERVLINLTKSKPNTAAMHSIQALTIVFFFALAKFL